MINKEIVERKYYLLSVLLLLYFASKFLESLSSLLLFWDSLYLVIFLQANTNTILQTCMCSHVVKLST